MQVAPFRARPELERRTGGSATPLCALSPPPPSSSAAAAAGNNNKPRVAKCALCAASSYRTNGLEERRLVAGSKVEKTPVSGLPHLPASFTGCVIPGEAGGLWRTAALQPGRRRGREGGRDQLSLGQPV